MPNEFLEKDDHYDSFFLQSYVTFTFFICIKKYKTIIDTLTQACLKEKEKNDYEELAKVYEAETGMPLSTDNSSDFEDLELYLNSKIDKS